MMVGLPRRVIIMPDCTGAFGLGLGVCGFGFASLAGHPEGNY